MKVLTSLFILISAVQLNGQSIHFKQIDSLLNTKFSIQAEPGFTLGIFRNGEVVYQNQKGLSNLEYEIPFDSSTLFGLASITKQFTSACIAVLHQKGRLSANDDVRKYLPELRFYGDTIRIKHLLNHTSGIRNHNVLLDLQGFDYEHRGYTNKMIQELMFQQKGVNNKPGEKVLYSNTNYVLLALIIERVSGKPLHEFAEQEIFKPLDMLNTFYQSDLETVYKNRAYPYYKSGENYKQPKSLTLCIGAGGVGTTLDDMAKWSTLFTHSGGNMKYLADFITFQDSLNNGEQNTCARGVFVSDYNGLETIHHGGRGLGMRAKLIHVPSQHVSVFVYTNSESINADDLAYQILDLLLPKQEAVQNEKLNSYTHKNNELEKITGTYQELNSDLKMQIKCEGETLFAKSYFANDFIALKTIGQFKFERKENASVTYTFNPSANLSLVVDFGGAKFYLEQIELATDSSDAADCIGEYYSEELQVSYSLQIVNNQLILSYPNNISIPLTEGRKDEFGSGRRTKYSFERNKKGKVVSFKVAAEGTVKDILFERVEL